jgi:hypothetical protein
MFDFPYSSSIKNLLRIVSCIGMFGDVEIGRANADDPDDWDYVDKHYRMISSTGMEKFFK